MPVLYLNETWLDASLMFRNCWQNKEAARSTANENASNKLIIAHMVCCGGFW
jgi:hypothetical protein